MKKISFIICLLFNVSLIFGQDFDTDIKNARSAYAAGKLGDAHFALLQAMQGFDIIVGKEVLKLLPTKMDTATAVLKNDQVADNAGFIGTTIARLYGTKETASIAIISNSPYVAASNTFLNTPMLGGIMIDGTSKIVKVQRYKARLQKAGDKGYTIDIPLSNALMTVKAQNVTDTKMLKMANSVKVGEIAKLIQLGRQTSKIP